MYGVVPCLFGVQCFKSVTARLDYLKDQGVDILWISPVFQTDDSSLISYATTDYFGLRDDFGSDQDFRDLIHGAHKRSMKVIMDIVPNHTSDRHPFYTDQRYHNFHDRTEDGKAKYYFDWENLPNLNYQNPEVRKMITESFLYWIKNYDIDGFRVDAAWGVKERFPGFWKPLIKKLRKTKADIIMLAEASAKDDYYINNGFDFAYDWTEELGKWSWEHVFKDYKRAPLILHQALKTEHPATVARFINNNDTGKRFISRYGLKMAKLAALLQHTVPGIPIVYNGDETGAEFDPYDDPTPLSWQDPHGLKAFYKKLAQLRTERATLHSGILLPLSLINSPTGVYAFARVIKSSYSLVVLNFSPSSTTVELKLPTTLRATAFRNLMTDKPVNAMRAKPQTLKLKLKAEEALLLHSEL